MPLQTHTDADFAAELQRFVAPSAHSSAPPFSGSWNENDPDPAPALRLDRGPTAIEPPVKSRDGHQQPDDHDLAGVYA